MSIQSSLKYFWFWICSHLGCEQAVVPICKEYSCSLIIYCVGAKPPQLLVVHNDLLAYGTFHCFSIISLFSFVCWSLTSTRLSLSPRSESSCSTGALGFSAWKNPEKTTKQPWAPALPQTTSTPTLPCTTPAPPASPWAPSWARAPPSPPPPPPPTGTWTCTSDTTPWVRTTRRSRPTPSQAWWSAGAEVEDTPMAPPNTTSTRNRCGLCCWTRFRKFPGSWRKCSTSPDASGIRTRGRPSAASGSLRRRWWIGCAWWPSRSSPSSAPSPSWCRLPISSRPCPRTSHKADDLALWEEKEKYIS